MEICCSLVFFFFFQAEDGIRDHCVTGVQTCALPISQTPLPTQPGDPAIPRAFTLRLTQGLPSEATDMMRFDAQLAGDYLIFCGVPGHGAEDQRSEEHTTELQSNSDLLFRLLLEKKKNGR